MLRNHDICKGLDAYHANLLFLKPTTITYIATACSFVLDSPLLDVHTSCQYHLLAHHVHRLLEYPGSALLKYCKYTHACTKGVLFRTRMYKMYVQETYCY